VPSLAAARLCAGIHKQRTAILEIRPTRPAGLRGRRMNTTTWLRASLVPCCWGPELAAGMGRFELRTARGGPPAQGRRQLALPGCAGQERRGVRARQGPATGRTPAGAARGRPGRLPLRADLGHTAHYEIRSLVPEFEFTAPTTWPTARRRPVRPVRPGDRSRRALQFVGIGCPDIAKLQVQAATAARWAI